MPMMSEMTPMSDQLMAMLHNAYRHDAAHMVEGVKARLTLSRAGLDPDLVEDPDGRIKGLEGHVVSLAGHGDRAMRFLDDMSRQIAGWDNEFPTLDVLRQRAADDRSARAIEPERTPLGTVIEHMPEDDQPDL